ncbi:MAG: response regulator transcription factor [Phreatobacter sp.]|uniref:response regulator transcription factor n=1 Tax=Phreatobacter sp. TaxID=1966341 RepID=UPI0027332255|nr:response regulator transcription factor [Phreatobacter sp.]MDP2801791.1 response regulator transcription factor [Phreatobacter sp.]
MKGMTMARRGRIAVLDDEPDWVDAVREYLTDLGYDVDCLKAAWELEPYLARETPDLIILDIGLPGENGIDILIRTDLASDIAVLVLTGNPDPIDRVLGLELGADDYVQKPVELRELAARVAGILQRRLGRRRSLVVFEQASVDLVAARILKVDGSTDRLSAGEVALIRIFAENPGKVLTREEIMEQAPAEDEEAFDRAIDSRIARLRRKLETEAIRTVRGHGYVFDMPSHADDAPGPGGEVA